MVTISEEAKRSLLLAMRHETKKKIDALVDIHQRTERELRKQLDEIEALDKLLGE